MMITIVLKVIVVNGSFIVIVTVTVTVVTIYVRACLLGCSYEKDDPASSKTQLVAVWKKAVERKLSKPFFAYFSPASLTNPPWVYEDGVPFERQNVEPSGFAHIGMSRFGQKYIFTLNQVDPVHLLPKKIFLDLMKTVFCYFMKECIKCSLALEWLARGLPPLPDKMFLHIKLP